MIVILLVADANTVDVLQYKWAVQQPVALAEDIEIAEFNLLGSTTQHHYRIFDTGNLEYLMDRIPERAVD